MRPGVGCRACCVLVEKGRRGARDERNQRQVRARTG